MSKRSIVVNRFEPRLQHRPPIYLLDAKHLGVGFAGFGTDRGAPPKGQASHDNKKADAPAQRGHAPEHACEEQRPVLFDGTDYHQANGHYSESHRKADFMELLLQLFLNPFAIEVRQIS